MNYKTLEQAAIERQKDGTFPCIVYEVLDDSCTLLFTPQIEAAMATSVQGIRTIRSHKIDVQ